MMLKNLLTNLIDRQDYETMLGMRSCFLTLCHCSTFTVELYSRHRFAWQFGYWQNLPGTLREQKKSTCNLDDLLETWNRSMIRPCSIIFLPWRWASVVDPGTSHFAEWWGRCMLTGLATPCFCSPFASLKFSGGDNGSESSEDDVHPCRRKRSRSHTAAATSGPSRRTIVGTPSSEKSPKPEDLPGVSNAALGVSAPLVTLSESPTLNLARFKLLNVGRLQLDLPPPLHPILVALMLQRSFRSAQPCLLCDHCDRP
ncbi:hypothetical protein H6P81_013244 [Aristolochia fimbriata]|uniref:Uncharacterized protein n=1 Tax=Aristolochia fimbriata TaxID=158543 RepID=A0AAV7EH21_ARIFI|nr:hypothetical protein H6P81_013244 [Aristolochia fimbriata]